MVRSGGVSFGVTRQQKNAPAVVAGAFLVLAGIVGYVDRGMTPFHDEWWFLCARSLANPASLFAPHNEHFVALHAAVYLAVQPLGYAALLAVLLGLHAAVVAAVYRMSGSLLAALVMTFLGSGYLNLFWAFQIGFVGAAALGLWALVAFTEGRPRLGAALLTLAVATQGNALFFIPAAGVVLWPRIGYLVPAVALYGAWFVVQPVVARGAASVTYALSGLVAAVGVANVGLVTLARPLRIDRLTIAVLVGVVAEYAALGLTRAGFAPADSPQYLYAAAPFVLIALGRLEVRRPTAITTALGLMLAANVWLLLSNGLLWPAAVAAGRLAGADVCP